MTHGARSDGEEMRAIVPSRSRLIHQLEVCLVHEPRRLKRPTAVTRRKMTMGDRAQLVIDDGHEFIKRVSPLAQRNEKTGRIERSLSHVLSTGQLDERDVRVCPHQLEHDSLSVR